MDVQDFLKSLTGGGGDLAGGIFNTLVAGATGGFKGRPQWRDLQFMNDATNRLWPDEINRQGQFLEGLAPSQGKAMETMAPYQAGAYNRYQDQTFQQDTARQTGRIQSMSKDLGMSPWEITGAGGANPLPSPQMGGQSPGQGQNPMPAFLQGIVPLQLAKMQNSTSLRIAKMQNETQRYSIDQTQGQSPMAKQNIANGKANEILALANTELAGTQAGVAANGALMSTIQTFLQALPTTTINMGPISKTTKDGGSEVIKRLGTFGAKTPSAQELANAIKSMPTNTWQAFRKDLTEAAKAVAGSVGDAYNAIKNDTAHKFLNRMTN